MDLNGLRRKDTTRGAPLRILSLDGGGVRGYSMFLILQELMHRTFVEIEGRAPRRSEIPKPCDHFDLIVGTGTGGLIALMLGRLRLDIETCKELYARLTRMVFETDKTIGGIPFRHTLFKATKLEEAIKECVREHTVSPTEGNDGTGPGVANPLSAAARSSAAVSSSYPRRHSSNASVVSFSAKSPTAQMSRPYFTSRGGDPNARLYDERENRTKTAVTAIYQGTPRGGAPAMLRSYDSRREPPPEFDCKIWEAGRATCAIGLAFKPIRIGQSVFHDDGAGDFNPSIHALDEATVNEWPGREVGIFVSVGTGKRPKGSDTNSVMWYEGFLGEFAEAKRKLITKIEGCEKIHEYMMKEHLAKRNVNIENYYRFNVEVGVGEFGMNEWHRLSEISTNTRRYLARDQEQKMVHGVSAKLARIHFAKQRLDKLPPEVPNLVQTTSADIEHPLAVELPGDMPVFPPRNTPPSRQSYEFGSPDRLSLAVANTPSPRSSGERVTAQSQPPKRPTEPQAIPITSGGTQTLLDDDDRLVVAAPTPSQYRRASGSDSIVAASPEGQNRRQNEPKNYRPPGNVGQQPQRIEPPPLPPKTPLPDINFAGSRRPATAAPPYPLDDGPPPAVNLARKPGYWER
ncbi:hypothetical protein VTK73DRAFT_3735 [Phialemonium thermophilum]|uniref:PNPLA domain-containing protein n=1 Tax=Phialemonium thermophilum TaxID=223376 RepID=A0ABR3Y0K3_9PEZI